MTHKLDPVLMEDWNCYLAEMSSYTVELMKMSGYKTEEIRKMIDRLVFPTEPHSFVIDRDRAERMGVRIAKTDKDSAYMKTMKAWLTGYMLTESQKHIIRYVLPKKGENNGKGRSNNQKGKRAKGSNS